MVPINEKKQLQCLYYAKTMTYEEIKRTYRKVAKTFEASKYNKHAFKGKTTKHRKGKVERAHAKCRYSVHLAALVIYYKKLLLGNKKINMKEIKCDKTLYEFLINK